MRDPKYRDYLKRNEYNRFSTMRGGLWARRSIERRLLRGGGYVYVCGALFPVASETRTEAKIWQLRSYCALGWTNEAENVCRG